MLTVEVKDWRAEDVLGPTTGGALSRQNLVNTGGGRYRAVPYLLKTVAGEATQAARRLCHPVRQDREYMVRLMDRCRSVYPVAAAALLHAEGPRQGGFRFPFGHGGILSCIGEQQLRQHLSGNLEKDIFPAQRVLTRKALEQPEHAGALNLLTPYE